MATTYLSSELDETLLTEQSYSIIIDSTYVGQILYIGNLIFESAYTSTMTISNALSLNLNIQQGVVI